MKTLYGVTAASLAFSLSTAAFADTIDPASYSAALAVGESVTITKTVTISETAPTSGLIDVMFLIDTSGSMGGEIAQAKAAAADILTGLAGFGDLITGFGYYSEPGSVGVYQDLTADDATTIAGINTWTTGFAGGGGGGDFPEEGINATYEAASGASWRPGSNRFIIALGDAAFKESDGTTLVMAQSALTDNNVTFIGIDYGYGSCSMTAGCGDMDSISVENLSSVSGGSIISSSGLDPADLVADILAGVSDAFATYDEVTVSDLGVGLPGVSVSVECVSADTGVCSGDTAVGDFDRGTERTFTFDVTFTGLEEGGYIFETCALVDGACVAREADSFKVGDATSVPEPGSLALLGLGLMGVAASRRKV